jgi:hypothetical protein
MSKLQDLFDKHDSEYGKFSRVQNKFSNRRDLHAFILLDKLIENANAHYKIISNSDHDEITISLYDKNCDVLTEENIIDLIRCGVLNDEDEECFTMFV